jgi:ubiquinone/menaquinone biosynthesis C-methylase UbiE
MTVIDLGCGPGFFTVPMAVMVGPRGRVIAIDLQEGMLEKLRHKIAGTDLEPRITLQKSEATRIGPTAPVDFVLAFYMVHEVPDREGLFSQIASVMRPGGRLLAVEPPFHVSTAAFDETIRQAGMAGLRPVNRPKVLFSKAILLQKV